MPSDAPPESGIALGDLVLSSLALEAHRHALEAGASATALSSLGLPASARAFAHVASAHEEDAAAFATNAISRARLLHAAASYALLAEDALRAALLAARGLDLVELAELPAVLRDDLLGLLEKATATEAAPQHAFG